MANIEKSEKYVVELAGPADRWLSVTDAARITRRQEKSIRDWIESGKLPVNPERTGLNKRTRLVRLSDLVTLTPVIDPDAGISTDMGLLDLPSIPKVQQRLADQMEQVQQEVSGQLGTLTTLTEKYDRLFIESRGLFGALHIAQEQLQQLTQQGREHQELIEQVCRNFMASLQKADEALRQELDSHTTTQVRALEQVRTESADLVAQSDQALRLWIVEQVGLSEARLRQDVTVLFARFAEVEQALHKELAGAVQELHSIIAEQDARWIAALKELDTRIAANLQARRVAHDQLQAQSDERYSEAHRQLTQFTMSATTLDGRLGSQETRMSLWEASMSQLETTWQQRAVEAEKDARQLRLDLDSQAKTQQALQVQLNEERKAREALAKQVEKLLQQSKRGKER